MKHFPVVFALAATSFCVVAHAAPPPTPTPVAPNANAAILPDASLEKYEKLMTEGRALKTSMVGAWSQSKSLEAVGVFQKAILAAPTLPLRAVAFIEGGEVLYSLAAYPQALDAFSQALRQTLAPETLAPAWKGRALWGIANVEFLQVWMAEGKQTGVLKLNAKRLRDNYDAAIEVRPLADADRREVWSNFAKIFEAEGKHLEAAREYSKLMTIAAFDSGKFVHGNDAINQLKKATALSTAQRKEAVAMADKIFPTVLPLLKTEEGKASWRVWHADLLSQFGESARAETMLDEIANDAKTPEKTRAETIVIIAQRQAAQKKYEAALLTLDRLPKLSTMFKPLHHAERAKVFLAQEQLDKADFEYSMLSIIGTPEEKVDGFWGRADVAEKQAAVLRLKKAPATEIAAKVEAQKRALISASSQRNVSRVTQRMSYEKLAQFESAQGNAAEAKKWQDAAKAAQAANAK